MATRSIPVHWLESPPHHNYGATFGLPWEKGLHQSGRVKFTCTTPTGQIVSIQSWTTAYWPDGSIKWTGHSLPAGESSDNGYLVHANELEPDTHCSNTHTEALHVHDSQWSIVVNTGEITATFPKSGNSIVSSISNKAGTIVARNGHLVLLTQSSILDSDIPAEPITYQKLTSTITSTTIENSGPYRTTVKITGHHSPHPSSPYPAETPQAAPLLPFTLRIYLYASSPLLRITHTIVFNLPPHLHIRGLALRLSTPLSPTPAYDRHIRLTTSSGGVLSEAAQPLTGLWKDPGPAIRAAQVAGQPVPPPHTWAADMARLVRWVPVWDAWRATQTEPDGFAVKKRTGAGSGWVRVPGAGGRGGGVAYLGAAGRGGVAVGQRWFWERCPTGLDVEGVGSEEGSLTAWLWSPQGGAMDVRAWRGSLGEQRYADQIEAMKVTYEDWEEGMGSPEGIARTNELFLLGTTETPKAEELAALTTFVRAPPVLVAAPERLHETRALGTYWTPASQHLAATRVRQDLDQKLDFLFTFYLNQVEQRSWYGFWDHGDIMHTYDADRHTWRYDSGGYAWDNSELSPDLWLWLYFFRTGRADVYRLAEALTRHTGEVDVYHSGAYAGLGTRHGVQHWSDSCKQARISNALYRRPLYYLTGGDERIGDLLDETLATPETFLTLDPYRKVRTDSATYTPDPSALAISLGTDWSALAASWFTAWERRGTGSGALADDARTILLASMAGIGKLANGFVTGHAVLDLHTGDVGPPAADPRNEGVVKISHLSAMFGLFEICAELLEALGDETPAGFRHAWVGYCRFFNASDEEQVDRFGVGFGTLQLRQGHSRLTAYAARELRDKALARRAWGEMFFSDGYGVGEPWRTETVEGCRALVPVEEAPWVSTNITALYGLAAIQNLALVGDELPNDLADMRETVGR